MCPEPALQTGTSALLQAEKLRSSEAGGSRAVRKLIRTVVPGETGPARPAAPPAGARPSRPPQDPASRAARGAA